MSIASRVSSIQVDRTLNVSSIENNVIEEDANEHVEEHSEGEQFNNDIKNFLKQNKANMQRLGISTKDIDIPKRIIKSGPAASKVSIGSVPMINAGPKMKGNIGPSMNNAHTIANTPRKMFSKLANVFYFDKVINKEERIDEASVDVDNESSVKSFSLDTVHDYEMDSQKVASSVGEPKSKSK